MGKRTDRHSKTQVSERDGGPAFPHWDGPSGACFNGMTLRDYFAAKFAHAEMVTAGSLEAAAIALSEAAVVAKRTITEQVAFNAYELADAMLKERAK